jgi:CRP-like cAMP-binding protein
MEALILSTPRTAEAIYHDLFLTPEGRTNPSLFERCSEQDLELLATTAYPIGFDPGDLVCAEGEDSAECYLIEEGQAVVTIGRKGVRTVGEDTVVGERGVLLDTVRSATVTAITHVITWAISRERLRAVVAGNLAARAWMLEVMKDRYGADGIE